LHLRSIVFCGVLALAGCQSVAAPPSPDAPGTTTTVRAPDTTRWMGRTLGPGQFLYTCRPLACAKPTGVRVLTSRSPSRTINAAALDAFAKQNVPASVKATDINIGAASSGFRKVSLVGSRTTTYRGFPAVVSETRHTGDGPPKFGYRVFLFAGLTLIDTFAISEGRDVAKAEAENFIEGYTIIDRPPQ
jgi:hypothetical protein